MRLEDLVEEQVMRSMVQRTTRALAKCQQAYIDVEDDTPPSFVATLATFVSSLGLSDFVFSTPPKPTSNTKDKATERAFSGLPPPDVSLLLFPFYDLLHRNKLFVSIIVDEQQRDFLPTLLSFSSYTLCHASTSQRSRHVARLALVTLTLVVEEGTTSVLASDHLAAPVRLCRQRLPQLPYLSDQKRPLLCAILDVVLIFLRHNITKHLDIESHL